MQAGCKASRETPAGTAGSSIAPAGAQQTSEQELDRLGDVALLSEAFWKTRLETQVRRDTARVARETAQEAITRLDRQIADLVVAEDLLAETDAIERLREGLAADRKARKSLPAEEANLRQALASIRDLLAESWPHLLSELREDEEPVIKQLNRPRDRDVRLTCSLIAS